MEVVGSDGKKVLWGVVDNHVVEKGNDHGEIVLRGFGFIFFDEYKGGGDNRRIV